MKRIIAIIITVSSSAYCFSQDIRIEDAVSVAEAFSYSITGEHHRAVKVIPQTSNDTICYYNILLDGNFICSVSSTSYAPPILSYSEKSNDFDMPDSEMPSAYIDLLKLYEKQIRAILSDTGRFYRYPEWIPLLNNNFGHDTINGFALLDSVDGNSIKWGQRGINGNLYACDKSYNHECPWAPFISCNKALAGCGPVAMAQLMRYWNPDESDESYSILQEEAMYSINPSIDNIDTTLTIYPNPSKDVFNIHISSGTIENITVYDNQSHTIYVDNNINSQEYLLNLQNHPRGLYTVNILSGNKYYSSSVLKQ